MKRLVLALAAQARTLATATAKTAGVDSRARLAVGDDAFPDPEIRPGTCEGHGSHPKPGVLKTISAIALTMLFAGQSFSQSVETDPVSKAKMSELGFIVGDWKGTGWSLSGPNGEKYDYTHTEKVRFKLDSTAILLEARYEYANGKTADNLSVLTYNKKDENYSFTAYGKNGDSNKMKAELIDGKFHIYPNKILRMVLWINEKGQWYEKAEYKNEDGWKTIDEMTLDRGKSQAAAAWKIDRRAALEARVAE